MLADGHFRILSLSVIVLSGHMRSDAGPPDADDYFTYCKSYFAAVDFSPVDG